MSINKAENTLENRLIDRIVALERAQREATTAQPIGGDVVRTATGISTGGPYTVAAGQYLTFNARFSLTAGTANTIWHFRHSVWVDAQDTAHLYPSYNSATSLTTGQRSLIVMAWAELQEADDQAGLLTYKVRIRNDDTVAHDYYFSVKVIIPAQNL